MGHWNHRVVRQIRDGETFYGIHEVFYGLPDESDAGWTEDPISPVGETVEELRETLERMMRALDKPVILDDDEKEQGTNS
jgi:hypothetical protein